MKRLTQDKAVLTWLQKNGTINPLEALQELGCFRLASVIHRLKNKGHDIATNRITKIGRFGKVNFAEYNLQNIGGGHG